MTSKVRQAARFQREAHLLASLNHPNIAAIHALEEANGVRFLVLELVGGETLAERLTSGPLPVDEALPMCQQIAEGLEAAHERGIIHRDLKPANVKVTSEGRVKILDFGLAKVLKVEVSEQELPNSPTLTLAATREGIVLGTPAYMSPEQARGKEVDKRTDIWSFGLLLFEMLTGNGMYAGKSLAETIAAVIHQEPSLDDLPRDTPLRIRELLERCLRKDPRMRLQDMGDARITIDECLSGAAPSVEELLLPTPMPPLWRRLAPWVAIPLVAVLAWSLKPDPPIPEKRVSRFEEPVGEGELLYHFNRHGLALSPDGTKLAYVAKSREEDSKIKIYVKSLDQSKAIPVGEHVGQPFFSPDGKWLGVHWRSEDSSENKLKKYPLEGGAPTTICDCREPLGASWGQDDTIVFACENGTGLRRVSASGGDPEQITEVDREAGERSHRLPHLLPGGKEVLYTVVRYFFITDWSQAQIVVQSLESGQRKVLIEGGSDARYVPTGHLVFAREATLMAVPFDLATLSATGPPVPVLEGVSHAIHTTSAGTETGVAQFAFSDSGSLAYLGGSFYPEMETEVLWVDRDGKEERIDIEPAQYMGVRLSPDGSKMALNTYYKEQDIWIYDFDRRTRARLTTKGANIYPIWSPQGSGLAFTSDRAGPGNVFWKALDMVSEAEHLIPSEYTDTLGSWSPDGSKLAFVRIDRTERWDPGSNKGWDIYTLSVEDRRSVEPLLASQFWEGHPAFSPDGRWLAYNSNESGRSEVYVRPYPGPSPTVMISNKGGHSPAWARRGSKFELFYRSGRNMMAVEITVDGGKLMPGLPVRVFEGRYHDLNPIRGYDVTQDGQRFLMVKTMEREEFETIPNEQYYGDKVSIVLNWFEELKRLMPTEE